MKLGDKLTMEAYNIWGDVPRKCRPPKIGDIPKHSAIDEESPVSIPKSLTLAVSESKESSLDVPLDSSGNVAFPLSSSVSADRFAPIRRHDGNPISPTETIGLRRPSLSTIDESRVHKSTERSARGFLDLGETVAIESPCEREDTARSPSSPENNSDREIVEVRKDSALFLEEVEGLPTLREILRTRPPRILRPRRESSGYASNLGTFDEDRRNSSTADALQDWSSLSKERRRSSTGPKRPNSRVTLGRAEGSLTVDIEVERMPTTEIHRTVSGAGLEMPNIEEVKEILRDEAPSSRESLDSLCGPIRKDRPGDFSARCRYLGDPGDNRAARKTSPELSPPRQDSSSIRDVSLLGESMKRLSTSPPPKYPTTAVHHSAASLTSSRSLQNVPRSADRCEGSVTCGTSSSGVVEQQQKRVHPSRRREDTILEPGKDSPRVTVLPRPVKMYQLLATQSEDTADGELHLDRRIAFQVSKQSDDAVVASTKPRNASLNKSSSVFALDTVECPGDAGSLTSGGAAEDAGNTISPGDAGTSERFLGDTSSVSARPIYPYCPYSPYGSPQGSPRNKRRPLRESRRVSIDNKQGALQLNQYKLLDNIGQGSYGIVKLVYNEEDETHYAMKILSKKKLMKKAGIFGRMAPGKKGTANPLVKVYREIALLKKLDHPNVVKLVEVLDDPDEDNLYLVFELVQKGEILQVPTDKPLDEETARENFRDVVMGVEYLHYQRIIHRDIKPSNLLVDSDGRIKIADLGVSAELRASGELLSGPAGTPAFAAPEATTPGAHYSGTLCDVWSLGVTLYCLVTGRVPWDGAGSIIGVQAAIRTEPVRFPDEPVLSGDLCDLISRMLAKDPAERATLAEIKRHAWLTCNGARPLPSEADNCRLPVTVTDEEVERVVTRIPKLDTLILIKTMLKQHSFQNPFLPKKINRAACNDASADSLELSLSGRAEESLQERQTARNPKTKQFQRTGRSNSAPDSYDWQTNGRQISVESPLPPVTEASSNETETEKR